MWLYDTPHIKLGDNSESTEAPPPTKPSEKPEPTDAPPATTSSPPGKSDWIWD